MKLIVHAVISIFCSQAFLSSLQEKAIPELRRGRPFQATVVRQLNLAR